MVTGFGAAGVVPVPVADEPPDEHAVTSRATLARVAIVAAS